MKYAHIIDTKVQGWYDLDIHSEIPVPNIEVTDEVWQEAININANCYEAGKFKVKDFRTKEEIAEQELQTKINEADQYLKDTDWVKSYLLEHHLGLVLIPEDSYKFEIEKLRKEKIEFLRSLGE